MPFINKDFINGLSQQVDIVGLINKRLALKKAGKDYKACCPFHEEKTPSFTVAPDKQIYHCFGCGSSGGVIDFVMNFDHLDFKEAVETVASESGISIIYDQGSKPVDNRVKRYHDLMSRVNNFYQLQLKSSPAKNKVIDYAKKRGISGVIAKRFEIGFAAPGWDNLFNYFKDNENEIIDLEAMGLLIAKDNQDRKYYDRFRDRLMFPIHNAQGNVIAFGGRALSKEDKAKYINSPETPIFSKSNELYGLYHCRKYSRSIDYVLVVEGYMDVVALHQGGITSVVATLGTATTAQHINTLSRTTNNIVFCFDGDNAGRKAAWKALQIALPIIKSGLIIKFLFLPDGEDPDTFIKKESNKSFIQRIDNADTLSKFLFKHLREEVDFDTIEGKTLFLENVFTLIKKIDYQVYKQQLIEGVADVVGQSVEHVRELFTKKSENKPTSGSVSLDYMPPMPPMPDLVDLPPMEYNHIITNKAPKKTSNGNPIVAKIITLVINYPSLASDKLELSIRNMHNQEVLLEIVRMAQVDENITPEDLIAPFKKDKNIYQRLKKLCILDPYLSQIQAQEEISNALNNIIRREEISQSKVLLSKANTIEEQKRMMLEIKSRKIKK